ncbi:DUF87 domain-containing protein [Weissella cibaria]|nr:DUF87 domain-containing protein [Weissella cibaria]
MHNMLSQYYSFLAKKFQDWVTEKKQVEPGDRFFALLDEQKDVDALYNTFKELPMGGKTEFNSQSLGYKTVSLTLNNIRLLIVGATDGVTNDFLVTLRNRISAQIGEFENTAIFFIVTDPLDSIIGGSFDVSQTQAPFDVNQIKSEIDSEIEKSNLTVPERTVLKSFIKNMDSGANTTVLKDFETVFSVLENGKITSERYSEMHLFEDNQLGSFDDKTMKNRIDNNQKLFNKIANAHEDINPQESLEGFLAGDRIINELAKPDEWQNVPFSQVVKASEEFSNTRKEKLELDLTRLADNIPDKWKKVNGESSAQRKKAHLVMSSVGRSMSEIDSGSFTFDIYFDGNVQKSSIVATNTYAFDELGSKKLSDDNFTVANSGKKLQVIIEHYNRNKTYAGLVTYKHKGINSLTFQIRFMIVPFPLEGIKKVQPNFEVAIFKKHAGENNQFGLSISNDLSDISFGNGDPVTIQISDLNELNNLELDGRRLDISGLQVENDDDPILSAQLGGFPMPIMLRGVDKPRPEKAIDIEYNRLNSSEELHYSDGKVLFGSSVRIVERGFRVRLEMEREMLRLKSVYGERDVDKYRAFPIALPTSIQVAYDDLIDYYIKQDTLPSLAILSDEHVEAIQNVLDAIKIEFGNLVAEKKIPTTELRNIRNIGVVRTAEGLEVSPLNPMLLQYQTELYRMLEGSEIPPKHMLNMLNSENLVPYIQKDGNLLQARYTVDAPRWIGYQEQKERMLTDMTSKIIQQRLLDYESQYKYLFDVNDKLAINVAAINIVDERNFFDAIVHFMLTKIEENTDIEKMTGVNVYFKDMGNTISSLFNQLYEITSMQQLNELLVNAYKKSSKINIEDYEILTMLKDEIAIYTSIDTDVYYHVTFYQFTQSNRSVEKSANSLPKNYALNGLVSSSLFNADGEDFFVSGFGIGSRGNESNIELIDFAEQWNAFLLAANDELRDYMPGKTLTNNVPRLGSDDVKDVMTNSDWVTLINPDVDLAYFFNDKNKDFFVIHYMDQSTNSQYEAVTVTANVNQYEKVLENRLEEFISPNKMLDTDNIIKSFNVLNGEWLLRLASEERHSPNKKILREKLSIISAFKESLGLLDAADIFWVPVSLEEILRVSTMVGLKQSEGMFSSKNLGQAGPTSDDLLFMGIDYSNAKLKVHLLPVEVKIGNNDSNVTAKAIQQVNHTADILKEYLSDENADNFTKLFYRNFFRSVLTTNLEKLTGSRLVDMDDSFKMKLPDIMDDLTTGRYDVSFDLQDIYRKGIVFEFTRDVSNRSAMVDNSHNVTLVKVPEQDAYDYVDVDVTSVVSKIQKGVFDFPEGMLLSRFSGKKTSKENYDKDVSFSESAYQRKTNTFSEDHETQKENEQVVESHQKDLSLGNYPDESTEIVHEPSEFINGLKESIVDEPHKENLVADTLDNASKSEFARILLGKGKNTNKDFYWEYGNPGLSNRHMIITGKSGQGKTYFIQTLLYELSKNKIDSIVVDYTDGFLPTQLEREFIEGLGNKIEHRIVTLEKLPFNPFQLREIDLGGGIKFPENVQDMIDRVTQVLDFVFKLGPQQKYELSNAIREGYQTFGDKFTFTKLKRQLEDSDSAQTKLLGRISTLLDRDPFAYDDDFTWDSIFTNTGTVHIFQLKGFQLNIQKILIEFMLWDLWGYSQATGSKDKPLPIVLDEVQNLDFSSEAPTVKILQEGRKFGWSGIFATQQIDSIKGDGVKAIYNATEAIHFLPPEVQVKTIAKAYTTDENKRAEFEVMLKSLKKGEAIDVGPNLNADGSLSETNFNPIMITQLQDRIDD